MLRKILKVGFLCLLLALSLCFYPKVTMAQDQVSEDALSSLTPRSFSFEEVEDRAEQLASVPFEDPDGSVPEFLLKVSYDQWRKIRFSKERSLWRGQGLPFELQFFHPGLFYNRLVRLNVVYRDSVERIPFSADFFEYGDLEFAEKVKSLSMDFAGFRAHFPLNTADYKDEFVVFLGASYFRAVAKDVQYGLSARGLAIDTAMQSGEEFPYFREFWIEKPESGDVALTVYALLDSPSLTGAYKFVVTPGEETAMDVKSRLFLRKDVQKLGIAPLTSMFLYGETENGWKGDFRPEVHDSDGLLVKDGEGLLYWRPLANPRRLSLSSQAMERPGGFGLFQRDGSFDHYQDLEARYEKRPSLWIEPKDWGRGKVELVEIPSEEEIHDNIVAYWVPEKTVMDDKSSYPKSMDFEYTMRWIPPAVSVHPLGFASATRIAAGSIPDSVKFVVDFDGGDLSDIPSDIGLTSVVTLEKGARLLEKQLMKNEVTGGWRLVFQVAKEADESIKTLFPSSHHPSVRITALLKRGENIPDPLTEIWTYDLRW